MVVEEEDAEEDEAQAGGASEDTDESYEDTSDASADTSDTAADTSDSGSSSQGTYLGNFTLTAYCNCAQCCGTAGNPYSQWYSSDSRTYSCNGRSTFWNQASDQW